MPDSTALPSSAVVVDQIETLGYDGRVWVDVEALVASLRGRAHALAAAAGTEPDALERATLLARGLELEGRADALAIGLLDEAAPPDHG
ncbi:hypothetical protein GCM10027047_02230 [Rhodococcus aerolatus]